MKTRSQARGMRRSAQAMPVIRFAFMLAIYCALQHIFARF
jgi:hypothetical protein